MSGLRITEFIAALDGADRATTRAVCKAEMAYLQDTYPKPNSQHSALTHYRNALRDINEKHPAIQLMRQSKRNITARKVIQEEGLSYRKEHLRAVHPDLVDPYLRYAESLLTSASYVSRLLGLAALTGRRTAELMSTAELEKISAYRARFTGQLKSKGLETGPYAIPLLADFDVINTALLQLQAEHRDVWHDPLKASKRTSKAISTQMKRLEFKRFLGDGLCGRDLRRFYGAVAFFQEEFDANFAADKFKSRILGHRAADPHTGGAYNDYTITTTAPKDIGDLATYFES